MRRILIRSRDDAQVTKGYAPASDETFSSLVPRYLRQQKANLTGRSYERTKGILERQLKPAFGNLKLGNIRLVDIEDYKTRRQAEVSAGTVVKELNVIKHLLNKAVEWQLIPFSPADGVAPPRVPAGRLRYLQPTELRALLAHCPNWLRPIAALAAFTGMRRDEVLTLRWLDVDLKGSRLMLPQTKNGQLRIVYLSKLATAVLTQQWHDQAKPLDLVFPAATKWSPDIVSKGLKTVCRRLGIEDFHFHDLRHTAASCLRMQGADIHTVAQLLGHKDLRMAARYQHLSPEYLGAAVARLDAVFGEPMQIAVEKSSGKERASAGQ